LSKLISGASHESFKSFGYDITKKLREYAPEIFIVLCSILIAAGETISFKVRVVCCLFKTLVVEFPVRKSKNPAIARVYHKKLLTQ
jgi:hypothetical protein